MAANSHKKALEAQKAGYFDEEIIPVKTKVMELTRHCCIVKATDMGWLINILGY